MPAYPTQPIARLLPDTMTISPDGVLEIASYPLPALALQYGTPLYIFDRATILNACASYRQAFQKYYKAYLSPLIAQLMAEQGLGLDIVSGGELLLAQRAAFPMEHVLFHGNNKSEDELRLALALGVGRIVLDNWSELERLTRIAREAGLHPKVLLRVTPDVETDTHRYLQTGQAASKFGFPLSNGEAKAALRQILNDGQLHLVGLHTHIGTMLRETRPYEEALLRLFVVANEVSDEMDWWPEEISPGGGWAIDTIDNATTSGIEELAKSLQATMQLALSTPGKAMPVPRLIIEPGRWLIARAGVAMYRIGG